MLSLSRITFHLRFFAVAALMPSSGFAYMTYNNLTGRWQTAPSYAVSITPLTPLAPITTPYIPTYIPPGVTQAVASNIQARGEDQYIRAMFNDQLRYEQTLVAYNQKLQMNELQAKFDNQLSEMQIRLNNQIIRMSELVRSMMKNMERMPSGEIAPDDLNSSGGSTDSNTVLKPVDTAKESVRLSPVKSWEGATKLSPSAPLWVRLNPVASYRPMLNPRTHPQAKALYNNMAQSFNGTLSVRDLSNKFISISRNSAMNPNRADSLGTQVKVSITNINGQIRNASTPQAMVDAAISSAAEAASIANKMQLEVDNAYPPGSNRKPSSVETDLRTLAEIARDAAALALKNAQAAQSSGSAFPAGTTINHMGLASPLTNQPTGLGISF